MALKNTVANNYKTIFVCIFHPEIMSIPKDTPGNITNHKFVSVGGASPQCSILISSTLP